MNLRIRLLALANQLELPIIRKSQSYNMHTELVRTAALFPKIIAKVKYEEQVSYREKPQVSKSGYSHLLKPYINFSSFRMTHAIRDSASPRPKMYWTRTFEELVPSLDTTSNQVTSFYLFSGKLEYPNKIIRFNTSIVPMKMNPCEKIRRR